MHVTVISKAGCARCLAAKAKLCRMGITFTEIPPRGELGGQSLPLIVIDGETYEYPAAMRELKGRLNL